MEMGFFQFLCAFEGSWFLFKQTKKRKLYLKAFHHYATFLENTAADLIAKQTQLDLSWLN